MPDNPTVDAAGAARHAAVGLVVFATPAGTCGLAWGERGILAVALPEGTRERTLGYLARNHPEADRSAQPPDWVRSAIERITAMLGGAPDDLADLPVDLSGVSEFARRVYALARSIPPGRTMTYGEVATALGDPGSARAVGHALGANPVPIVVPCHRVLAAGGRMGGFSAPGGVVTKQRLLMMEGAGEAGLFGADALFP